VHTYTQSDRVWETGRKEEEDGWKSASIGVKRNEGDRGKEQSQSAVRGRWLELKERGWNQEGAL